MLIPADICIDYILTSPSNTYYAIMQGDGNLVVYNNSIGTSAVWSSNTSGKGKGPFCLRLQTDGNLGIIDSTNTATWYSNSYNRGQGPYSLIMQDDANLVIKDSQQHAIWSWKTGPI
jgi:hypothetical protein